jgi:hypothetical protein
VIVKGKSIPFELFELRHKFSAENFDEIARTYSKAFALYQEGQFAQAERRFLALSPCDPPSKVLAQRCADLTRHQPPGWNGVFIMIAK